MPCTFPQDLVLSVLVPVSEKDLIYLWNLASLATSCFRTGHFLKDASQNPHLSVASQIGGNGIMLDHVGWLEAVIK